MAIGSPNERTTRRRIDRGSFTSRSSRCQRFYSSGRAVGGMSRPLKNKSPRTVREEIIDHTSVELKSTISGKWGYRQVFAAAELPEINGSDRVEAAPHPLSV